MKRLLAMALVLFVTVQLSVGSEKPKEKNWNIDYGYSRLGCTVSDMPYEIRNVPVHEDDFSWGKNQGLVTRKDYKMNNSFSAGIMYAKEITLAGHVRPSINIGAGLDWLIYPLAASGGDMSEETYQGEGREIGSALTYVTLRQNGIIPSMENIYTDVLFNWTPRAKIEIAPLGDTYNRFWLGTSISYYTVDVQTGWDRYSSLEPKQEYVLAQVFPIRVYGIWFLEDNTDFGFTAGVQYQPSSIASLGEKAGVEIASPTYYIGFSARN